MGNESGKGNITVGDIDFSPQWIFPKEVFKDGNGLLALFSYLCASGANSIVVMLFIYRHPEIANFKIQR